MNDDEPSSLAVPEQGGRAPDAYEKQYMTGEGPVLHRAKERAPWLMHAGIASIATTALAPAILGVPGAWLAAAIGLPILFAVWMLFSVLRVTVSQGRVNVQYGVFGPTIPMQAIESAEATRYDWKKFGGWGIRRSSEGEWIYNMPGDGGRAVRIVWRDAQGNRKVTLVGSREPEALANAIHRGRRALPEARSDSRAIEGASDQED